MARVTLLALALLAGCRTHPLEDGTFTFAETGSPLRDDCGLAGQGVLGEGTLDTTGHLVTMALTRPPGTLSGTYRYNLEELLLDGQFVSYTTPVRGVDCLVQTAALHLETTTEDAAHFTGLGQLTYTSTRPEVCSCQYWFTFRATRVGP
jgi:hypothetical protein